MIRVSRRTPPEADARKAAAAAASGRSMQFTGDPRHLRKLQRILADRADLRTYLAHDGDEVFLMVEPIGPLDHQLVVDTFDETVGMGVLAQERGSIVVDRL